MNTKISSQYDFLPRFLKLATVNVASSIVIPLAGGISVAFLGHLPSINYLAGVALGAILFNYLYESCSFIRSGTTAITSQAVGRDDREAIILALIQNALIALGLGMLILLLQYPLGKLGFTLLNAPPEVKIAGIAYFNHRIWGAPAALLNLVLMGWFLGREQNSKVLLLTIIGSVANISLDYLYIVLWGWSSMGAGLSQATSQYITLFVGLVMISLEVSLKEIGALIGKVLNLAAFQNPFVLNRNLFVRSIIMVSIFALFNTFSATLGTNILAENALFLQVVALSVNICSGVGYATATLSGNFKGQGAKHQFVPLLQIALGINLVVALVIGLVAVCFPNAILQIFTNHSELIEAIKIYSPWLLIVLVGAGVASVLDGYFSGLAEGETIRNAYLINGSLGIIFLCLANFYFHSNHFLWLAMSIFMVSRIFTLGIHIPKTLESDGAEGTLGNLLSNSPASEVVKSTSVS